MVSCFNFRRLLGQAVDETGGFMIRRCEVVDPTQVQIFHVFNRCVRRAFLCGVDSVSGMDYSHRKDWLQSRMDLLLTRLPLIRLPLGQQPRRR